MIVNIRGTSGCGKSHLVRRVMDSYEHREQHFIEGRMRPIGYECFDHPRRNARAPLWVIGHYETPCGGCDTISKGTLDYVYETVRHKHEQGFHLMYEGLVVTSDTRRCGALHTDGLPVLVVAIDESIETCVASVEARRRERGDDRPLNPRNTISKYWATVSGMTRLQDEWDVDARWLEREDAFKAIMEVLT
jgi:hypothetical protein